MTDLSALLLEESPDDEGNARCAHAMFADEFCFSAALGWLHYTGTYWRQDAAEAEVDKAILAMLKQRRLLAVGAGKEAVVKATPGSTKRLRDCKAIFRSLVDVDSDCFDQHHAALNVANGVLDLRTKTLTPHSPAQYFTYCLNTPYDPNADAETWTNFLREVLPATDGEALLAYLQMAVGYTLTGETSEECLWYVFGPSRSGKGAFTETLLALLGTPLATEVDFATFTAKREGDTQNFDLAPLKPARLIITSESNRYESLNTGKIKQLTGGNYIRCAYKHRAHFTYRPQFKAWLVSNHPVSADVDDDALWYRVKVLVFPHSHIGREDKHLKQRLRAPAVLAGVLRWAVDGAAAWYASDHGLAHPPAVDTNTQTHRDELDMVQLWIDECCHVSPGTWASHENLYHNYSEWCKTNGVEAKKAKGFTIALKSKGFLNESRYNAATGSNVRIIQGMGLLR